MEMTFCGDKVKITEGWMEWGRICSNQGKEDSLSLCVLMGNRLMEPAGEVKYL